MRCRHVRCRDATFIHTVFVITPPEPCSAFFLITPMHGLDHFNRHHTGKSGIQTPFVRHTAPCCLCTYIHTHIRTGMAESLSMIEIYEYSKLSHYSHWSEDAIYGSHVNAPSATLRSPSG